MRFFADTIGMFLRSKNRFKDGKQHRYWSIVENRRVADGRVVQRQVLYLGEINDSQKGRTLFGVRFDVLLYDLTSTYFESEPPQHGKRKYGYSRDKRPDCVQVVIALIVTPDGLPLAYEVLPGNTSDKTTLEDFLAKIEDQYGKAERVWIMDRGIPTEDSLAVMRADDTPVRYLVGTPKGRLSKLEKAFLAKPWAQVRERVDVKLLEQEGRCTSSRAVTHACTRNGPCADVD